MFRWHICRPFKGKRLEGVGRLGLAGLLESEAKHHERQAQENAVDAKPQADHPHGVGGEPDKQRQ